MQILKIGIARNVAKKTKIIYIHVVDVGIKLFKKVKITSLNKRYTLRR
jgi:hypothetical protein